MVLFQQPRVVRPNSIVVEIANASAGILRLSFEIIKPDRKDAPLITFIQSDAQWRRRRFIVCIPSQTYGTDGHGRDGGEDGARGDMPQNQTIEPQ